ncbi:MAG: T9SS type A sorting domain-containing protein [Bacteroidales bacterium]|nr:T9SS type A sorting domain-containing protein [Bacteroidales bacterium]
MQKLLILLLSTFLFSYTYGQKVQTLTTKAATNVSYTSATLNGTVNPDGESEWVKFEYGLTTSYGSGGWADPMSVSGSIDVDVIFNTPSNLEPNTLYHFRVLFFGVADPIGGDLTFTTLALTTPTLTTNSVTEIRQNSAKSGGVISDNGGSNITAKGVCWNTSGNPTTADDKTNDGSGDSDFNSTMTGLIRNTTYYVKAYATNSTGTGYGNQHSFSTTTNTEWTGSTDSDWDDSNNWTDGVPSSDDDVIIPSTTNNPNVNISNAQCYDMDINAAGALTIPTAGGLTVGGDLTIKASSSTNPASLNIQGSGSLTVTGTTNTECYISGTTAWHYISPPVASHAITVIQGYYANSYNESTPGWVNLTGSSTLTKMNGYSVKNNSGSATVTFTGTLNNGNQSISVTNSGTGDDYGWNLIGNPYPSYIDWDAASGWTRHGSDTTVYLYDASSTQYATFNHANGYSTNGGSRYIPPLQGFFIHVSTNNTVQMTNAVRVNSTIDFWKKTEEDTLSNALTLIASGNDCNDEIGILFDQNATTDFDVAYDAYKLFSSKAEIPQLYTNLESGSEMAVNVLPLLTENISINIGFMIGVSGEYSISTKGINTFDEKVGIFLEDTQEDIIIDLREENYNFSSDPVYSDDRFIVHFHKAASISEKFEKDNSIIIYSYNNCIYIKNNTNKVFKGQAIIYNILGEEVFREQLNNFNLNKFDLKLSKGSYIVKVISNKRIYSEKILIN